MRELARTISLVAAWSLPFGVVQNVQAFRNGAPSTYTGSPNSGGFDCSICHAGSTGVGSVQILGVPAVIQPDTMYDLLVRVYDPDQAGAGFEISVEDDNFNFIGTLILSDSTNTEYASNDPHWITQTGDGYDNSVANWAAMGNSVDYALQWLSPAVLPLAPFSFYASGNAVDNDRTFDGDHVYTIVVRVPEPANLLLLLFGGVFLLARRRS